jgi:hypothetical protein
MHVPRTLFNFEAVVAKHTIPLEAIHLVGPFVAHYARLANATKRKSAFQTWSARESTERILALGIEARVEDRLALIGRPQLHSVERHFRMPAFGAFLLDLQ